QVYINLLFTPALAQDTQNTQEYLDPNPAFNPDIVQNPISYNSMIDWMQLNQNGPGASIVNTAYAGQKKLDYRTAYDKRMFQDLIAFNQTANQLSLNSDLNINQNSVVFDKNYLVKRAKAVSIHSKNPFYTGQIVSDWRITKLQDYLLAPKTISGEGHDWIQIAKWLQKQEYSTESPEAEQNEKRILSKHFIENGQAVQISQMDYIKCTTIEIDENCKITSRKPMKPFPIDFAYQVPNQINPSDPGNGMGIAQDNSTKNFGRNLHKFLQNTSINILKQILTNQSDLNANYAAYIPNSTSGPTITENIGWAFIKQAFQLPANTSMGTNFSNNITNLGQSALHNIFNEVLPNESFKGTTFRDWMINIGRTTLSNNLFGEPDRLKGKNSDEILKNIGRSIFEKDIFDLKTGTLNKSASNHQEITTLIGEGIISKQLNLNFSANSTSELKQINGEEKYNQSFSDLKMTANTLGISYDELKNNLDNPMALKRIVGQRAIENTVDIYKDYTIPDSDKTINAKDFAFDTMQTIIPEINVDNKNISTIQNIPNKGVEKTNYPYTEDSKLYENLFAAQQENSVINQFLNPENSQKLEELYKKVGIDALAKAFTDYDGDLEYLREWFRTGNIPRDENEAIQINTAEIGTNFGFTDTYDIARLINDQAEELFYRKGYEQYMLSFEPSTNQYTNTLQAPIEDDATIDFTKTKIEQIQKAAANLPEPAKSDVLTHISIAIESKDKTPEEVATNHRLKTVSRSLYNIGKVLMINKLNNTPDGLFINKMIGEILAGKELSTNSLQLKFTTSYLNLGISQKDINDFLNLNKEDMNIEDFTNHIGKKVMASFLDTSIKNIEKAMSAANENKSPDSIYNILKDPLTQTARGLMLSLVNQNDKFTAKDFASILSGIKMPLIKIGSSEVASGLQLDINQFKSLLQGDGSITDKININTLVDAISFTGADSDVKNNVKDLIKSLANPNANLVDIGINWLPNIFSNMPNENSSKEQKQAYKDFSNKF
ncbi:MAG: hypothetical protein ACTSRA_18800, partial [Promethearchaeota archaeon]